MDLDFNKVYLDLEDKPVLDPAGKEINIGKFLANILTNSIGSGNNDPFKIDSAMKIAKKLYKGEVIEAIDTEAELLKEAILQSQTIISLKSQLLSVISNAKLSETSEKK